MYFLNLALQVSTASKCLRAQYGTVIISRDGRVVSTGYNGKPRGSCNDNECYRLGLPDNASKPNCCLHSETNALLFCNPLEVRGGTMYVSGIPCIDCMLLIMQSGIGKLVYLNASSASGHKGNFDIAFVEKYGFMDKIEIVSVERIQ